MGTRGLIGFKSEDEVKVTYNHLDSYPEYLGKEVLEFLLNVDILTLTDRIRAVQMVDEADKPTNEQIAMLQEYTDLTVSSQSDDDWYCILRGTQGDPNAILNIGYMIDSFDFGYDSLFCEWGYVIDLDKKELVVYRGFQQEEHDEGLWAKGDPYHSEGNAKTYYPIRPVKSWSFDELPQSEDEFLTQIGRMEEMA